MSRIERFHYLTQEIPGYTHAQLAAEACKGGARWVQLRVKGKPDKEWLAIAEAVKKVCDVYRTQLIINDNAEIAKKIKANGVHLGQEDMPPAEARVFLGNQFIIGGTANSLEDIQRLMLEPVDYIGLGPYRFTETKEKLNSVLGVEGIKKIISLSEVKVPVIAIGGIQVEDVGILLQSGVYGIAVSSAVNRAEDIAGQTKIFTELLDKTVLC